MQFAERVKQLPPYLFVGISRAIAEKKKQGIDVISFGIGDPDIPTPNSVIEELKKSSDIPANHRYPETEGLPEYRGSVAKFYKNRFGIDLDPESQIINLIYDCTVCSITIIKIPTLPVHSFIVKI